MESSDWIARRAERFHVSQILGPACRRLIGDENIAADEEHGYAAVGSPLPGSPSLILDASLCFPSALCYGRFLTGKIISMAYVIAEPCIGTKDTACVDACPVDCIHPKKDEAGYAEAELLYIDPVECIDCGACVPVCPVSAIFALDDLPEKWSDFTAKNAAYYGR
jgi:ferredoxin